MMAMPIMVRVSKSAASKKIYGSIRNASTRGMRERITVYEGSSGPRELMEAIVIQAQAALKGLEGVKPTEQAIAEMTEEQKRMTSDDKGKGKEKDFPQSPENLKLRQFWCVISSYYL